MITKERKLRIKAQIDFTKSEKLIKQIEDLLEKEEIEFPQNIIDEMKNAEKRIEEGRFITNEQLEKELEEWLNE
ncbi:hypothetical protein SDC9_203051 [bioreactor metagenome]|uniref:Uncharacterized protein n=2 Tax=root TaxID=1 RepID=A0A0J7J068_9FLAO|nr:hypothetical protein [Chryseobacterium koreense]KMQ71642.1 hypothetical protein ACM44_05290 [Chryseobacterium koreense CCUG 49689]MBB5333233.1 putative transcriptional regulator [Chryseobacterium koreense]